MNSIFNSWETANIILPDIIYRSFRLKVSIQNKNTCDISLLGNITKDDLMLIPKEDRLLFKTIIDTFTISIFNKIQFNFEKYHHKIITKDNLELFKDDLDKTICEYETSNDMKIKDELIRALGA